MKRFKNNTINVDSWVGQEIQPGDYYTIQDFELHRWQNDSKVLTDIASGSGIINDGTSDITDVATAINFLKDKDNAPKDSDGSPLSRVKVTTTGWNYQMLAFEITTADDTSQKVYCNDENGQPLSYFTYKLYDSNNIETNDTALAVKTIIDFEPPFDYEIMSGQMLQKTIPASDIYLHVIAVPDIPALYGGTKKFLVNFDLTFLPTNRPMTTDGKAPKRLTYSPTLHTNKIRFIFNHPAGFKHKVLQMLEYFKA